MPSSTSSSSPPSDEASYERPLPVLRGAPLWLCAIVVFGLALGAWEWAWRDYGSEPGIRNSDSLWAAQRRRIDHGEGGKTVIVGSSRLLFDIQLPVWERLSGERPIQLALEGTSPMSAMEDLAADPDFSGRLIVGVTPDLFFSGRENRKDALKRYRDETPAQRSGQWLSQHLLEPWLAFYDPDFALFTVLERLAWPPREGVVRFMEVRKLKVTDADRNTRMWSKLESDPQYAALARRIWAQRFDRPPPGGPEAARKNTQAQIERAVAATARLRARGVRVVFVRAPSSGEFLAFEDRALPRAQTWDVLMARTGGPGVHFQDHPALQGYDQPEWSHLSGAQADRFTAALQPLVEAAFETPPNGH
jgi:hypothetical protein